MDMISVWNIKAVLVMNLKNLLIIGHVKLLLSFSEIVRNLTLGKNLFHNLKNKILIFLIRLQFNVSFLPQNITRIIINKDTFLLPWLSIILLKVFIFYI